MFILFVDMAHFHTRDVLICVDVVFVNKGYFLEPREDFVHNHYLWI